MSDRLDGRVRATCSTCGEIEVAALEARLVAGLEDGRATRVELECPTCGRTTSQPVDARVARLLLDAGVPLVAPPGEPDRRDAERSRQQL